MSNEYLDALLKTKNLKQKIEFAKTYFKETSQKNCLDIEIENVFSKITKYEQFLDEIFADENISEILKIFKGNIIKISVSKSKFQ